MFREKKDQVSLKELRETFYRLRDFELSHLWQRSIFLAAFLTLLFPAYGHLLFKLLDETKEYNNSNIFWLHSFSIVVAVLGIIFSLIWIMMSKASKAWYEVYESAICKIEGEPKLKIPQKYRMGEVVKLLEEKPNRCVFSTAAGSYSVSRLNVIIGIVLLIFWSLAALIHIGFLLWEYVDFRGFVPNVLLIIAIVALVTHNKWAKSGILPK